MIRFNNDYNRPAHPRVLEALRAAAADSYPGYGTDALCARAQALVREITGAPEAAVWFFPGATQANFVVISAALSSVESVICAESGHIHCHEAASVEHVGHKLQALPAKDGKISAAQIAACASAYYDAAEPEYLTAPKLVYLSFPTELGTLYSRAELQAIHEVCRQYGMYLFVDGARLGYGLGSAENDVTVQELAKLADVFYFGGTKCGAMFGEAVVITADALKPRFKTYMKQNGAVLAKGWLLGAQFCALLEDGLYFRITAEADRLAMKLRTAFAACGIPITADSPTNQQFVLLTPEQAARLAEHYTFEDEGTAADGRKAVRFCTSWATTEAEVDALIADLQRL